MKNLFLLLAFVLLSAAASGQTIAITDSSVSAVDGGVNVNVKTISFNGAGYLSNSYTITGNTIDLSACYYFNFLLPILTFDNDFFIPVTDPGNYTVNITVYNSSSTETCDYFSSGGSATHNVLSAPELDVRKTMAFSPNPTHGLLTTDSEMPIEHLLVFDQLGRLVLRQDDAGNTIDLSGLQNGVYLLNGTVGQKNFTQKIIKY